MRIVVRSRDARSAREAQALLAAAGIEAVALPGAARSAEGEDVVIVPALKAERDSAAAFAKSMSAERAPLMLLAGIESASPPPLGLTASAPFTGVIALDATPQLLSAQIAAFVRDGIAAEERNRRRATAVELGHTPPKQLEPRKLKALYVGAPSPFFLKLEACFSQQAGTTAAAFSSFAGFDYLHDENFDCVVLNGAQDAQTAVSLCAALRRNAALYHLPTLVLTAPNDEGTAHQAIKRGACVTAPADTANGPALGWLFEAIRRERRRRNAEHELRALRDIMGEARTGLFRTDPFYTHLARLADDHHASGRTMSVAALRVMPAHGAREPAEDVWRKGFAEIASLASRLIRDADCGATIGKDFIALALPATDVKGARRTAERVASVAECTAFASGETGAGPLVFEQSCAELQPGESGKSLLARALGGLEAEKASA